jgi:HEAT repeat protein
MEAAMLLAMSGEENAHEYLRQLAGSNDLVLQLQAAGMLYLIGDVVPENLIRQGLESGKRDARIMAASLSGLAGYKDAVPTLRPLFMDRSVQYSAPAARALARLDDHTILDRLQAMLFELQQEKGEAAIFALTKLQDASVIEGLKFRLLEADGSNRLRIARVLFNLGDPTGIDELQHIFKTYPTLMPEVALMLAANGYWDAIQFLQTRLARREDPTESNLAFRARNAQALLASGDPSAMAVFQELLRSDKEAVTSLVFSLMTELGQPRLITLLQPSIENSNPAYALDACKAVISLALPSFRTRLLEYRIEFPEITH